MSGPYNQQALGQGVGRVVGLAAGQTVSYGSRQRSDSTSTSGSSVNVQKINTSGAGVTNGLNVTGGSGFTGGAAGFGGNAGLSYGSAGSYQPYATGGGYAYGGNTGAYYTGSTESFGQRRQGRVQRQVIRLPDQQQGQVRQVRRRLPTPEPDLLERVYIQRLGNEIIEEITEVPTTPPPRVNEKTVVEPAGPPQVIKKVIRVAPRSGSFGGYQLQQSGGNLLNAVSYGNIQQASSSYQPYTGYGSVGGGYGSVGGGYGSVGGGYASYGTNSGFGYYNSGYNQGYNYGGYGSQTGTTSSFMPGAVCFQV